MPARTGADDVAGPPPPASGDDLDAHLAAPHLRDFAARIPELLDERGPSVNRVRRIA